MPFSSRMEAKVFGVRSFQAMGHLRCERENTERVAGSGGFVRVDAKGSPVGSRAASDCVGRSASPARMRNAAGKASGTAPSAAGGPLRKVVRAADLPGAHRVVERARTWPARLALGVEAAASGQCVAATAGAAPAVGDPEKRL